MDKIRDELVDVPSGAVPDPTIDVSLLLDKDDILAVQPFNRAIHARFRKALYETVLTKPVRVSVAINDTIMLQLGRRAARAQARARRLPGAAADRQVHGRLQQRRPARPRAPAAALAIPQLEIMIREVSNEHRWRIEKDEKHPWVAWICGQARRARDGRGDGADRRRQGAPGEGPDRGAAEGAQRAAAGPRRVGEADRRSDPRPRDPRREQVRDRAVGLRRGRARGAEGRPALPALRGQGAERRRDRGQVARAGEDGGDDRRGRRDRRLEPRRAGGRRGRLLADPRRRTAGVRDRARPARRLQRDRAAQAGERRGRDGLPRRRHPERVQRRAHRPLRHAADRARRRGRRAAHDQRRGRRDVVVLHRARRAGAQQDPQRRPAPGFARAARAT